MKLVGELKKKVLEANDKNTVKKLIEEAGMELSDEEIESVAGGIVIVAYDEEKKEYKKKN